MEARVVVAVSARNLRKTRKVRQIGILAGKQERIDTDLQDIGDTYHKVKQEFFIS